MKKIFFYLFSFLLLFSAVSDVISQRVYNKPVNLLPNKALSAKECKKIIMDVTNHAAGQIERNNQLKYLTEFLTRIGPGLVPDYTLIEKYYNNNWTLTEGYWFTYDYSGQTSDITWKNWNGSEWINSERLHFTSVFVADMYLPEVMEWYEWEGKGWNLTMKEEFEYDQYGNNILLLYQYWIGQTYSKGKHEFSYKNIQNGWYLEDDHGYFWTDYLNDYQNMSWYHYDYDGTLRSFATYYFWYGINWTESSRYQYNYDPEGRLADEYGYVWDINQWAFDTWSKYYYYEGPDPDNYIQKRDDFEYNEQGLWIADWRTEYSYNNDWYTSEILNSDFSATQYFYVDGQFFSYFYDQSPPYDVVLEKYWFATGKSMLGWVDSTRTTNYYFKSSDVNDFTPVPEEYTIANYPNPFNSSTRIEFSIPRTVNVTVSIYDIEGNLVTELVNEKEFAHGRYSVHWNGNDSAMQPVSSGVYFYQIKAGFIIKTGKCVLLK